jgi:phosphodiesterase/alkaline phosphatase D-like protein
MNHTAPETGGGSQRSHRVDLNGLQPGTTYFLALVDSTGKQAGAGQFTTYATNYSKDKTVDITNGPVIEYLSDRQAVIAWSTDQKSSTVVKYGTDPSSLNLTAEAAWSAGNATHRVTLNNLQPNTKYWFQIQSAQTQGTNPAAHSPEYPFQTVQNASAALRFTPAQH